MSSQPNEEDPMRNHSDLRETSINILSDLQETSINILSDHHFDRDYYAEAMNLSFDSSNDLHLLQGHVTFDHTINGNQETRRRERGKEVAVIVDEHEHEHHIDDHDHHDHDDDGSNCAKKQEHNAKERLRRMKLHASYLTLGTLLPDLPSSKKKWSAPVIIDRVLTYIPKLQNEIEKLNLRKEQIITAIETKNHSDKESNIMIPMVSVHRLGREGEMIVQICMRNEREDSFMNLLNTLESNGMIILSASTALVCSDQRIFSYHLHVKMEEDSCQDDRITLVRKIIISSLT